MPSCPDAEAFISCACVRKKFPARDQKKIETSENAVYMGEGPFGKGSEQMKDEEIVSLFERRDEEAITAAQQKYGRYCLTIANRIVFSPETGEECLNDALHSAWTSIPPQRPKNLKLYLAALTRNHALNRREKETAQKRGGTEADAAFEELSECLASEQTPESAALEKELSGAVNRFLATLPEKQRNVFLRRYFFIEDTQTIAKRYAMRESNVLLILSRTRKKLKNFLQTEGFTG